MVRWVGDTGANCRQSALWQHSRRELTEFGTSMSGAEFTTPTHGSIAAIIVL